MKVKESNENGRCAIILTPENQVERDELFSAKAHLLKWISKHIECIRPGTQKDKPLGEVRLLFFPPTWKE